MSQIKNLRSEQDLDKPVPDMITGHFEKKGITYIHVEWASAVLTMREINKHSEHMTGNPRLISEDGDYPEYFWVEWSYTDEPLDEFRESGTAWVRGLIKEYFDWVRLSEIQDAAAADAAADAAAIAAAEEKESNRCAAIVAAQVAAAEEKQAHEERVARAAASAIRAVRAALHRARPRPATDARLEQVRVQLIAHQEKKDAWDRACLRSQMRKVQRLRRRQAQQKARRRLTYPNNAAMPRLDLGHPAVPVPPVMTEIVYMFAGQRVPEAKSRGEEAVSDRKFQRQDYGHNLNNGILAQAQGPPTPIASPADDEDLLCHESDSGVVFGEWKRRIK